MSDQPDQPRSTSATRRKALLLRLQEHIATTAQTGAGCGMIVIRPTDRSRSTTVRAGSARPVMQLVADKIRTAIRRDDIVDVHESTGIAILLRGGGVIGARAVMARLKDMLQESPAPTRHKLHLSLGYSAIEIDGTADCDESLVRTAWKTRAVVTSVLHPAQSGAGFGGQHPGPVLVAASLFPDESAAIVAEGHSAPPAVAPPPTGRSGPRSRISLITSPPARADLEQLRKRAQTLGVPLAEVPTRLPSSCRRVIRRELAVELQAVPIGRTRGVLTVAMNDPQDSVAVVRLRDATGMTIFPVLATLADIERAWAQLL